MEIFKIQNLETFCKTWNSQKNKAKLRREKNITSLIKLTVKTYVMMKHKNNIMPTKAILMKFMTK